MCNVVFKDSFQSPTGWSVVNNSIDKHRISGLLFSPQRLRRSQISRDCACVFGFAWDLCNKNRPYQAGRPGETAELGEYLVICTNRSMIVHNPHVMLIRSIFTTLVGPDRICATIRRFTIFTNNNLSKSFRCSKTEKDARIMEFGCFRANQRRKSCLISLIKPRVRSGAECRPTLLVWRWHLFGLVYLRHIFCYRDYTGTYDPLLLFPAVRRDFLFFVVGNCCKRTWKKSKRKWSSQKGWKTWATKPKRRETKTSLVVVSSVWLSNRIFKDLGLRSTCMETTGSPSSRELLRAGV